MARGSRSRSRRRAVSTRPQRRTLWIYCEDKVTEPGYLKALVQEMTGRDMALSIKVIPGPGRPLGLVEKAAKARDEFDLDDVWCVFDVEAPTAHPDLTEAMERAEAIGVSVALSNPCFELWLLLHEEDQCRTAYLTTDEAKKAWKGYSGTDWPIKRRDRAADRAGTLAARHNGNGTSVPHDNPSSTVYRLVEAIEAAAGGSES